MAATTQSPALSQEAKNALRSSKQKTHPSPIQLCDAWELNSKLQAMKDTASALSVNNF